MNKFIGDKRFYEKVLKIAVPIIIQNGITNFVGLLDNIMVGKVGTEQMSGVAISNQLLFVFNLCIFGGISGAGIFGAQFFGQKNYKGVRDTFRFKLVISAIITALGILVLSVFGNDLISLYLHEGSRTGNIVKTLVYGRNYMLIMFIGLVPFAIEQSYSSTLRETGETLIPMKAGITAVFVNLFFNYVLIFGKFGSPVLGVEGAAIATVISRFVESTIIVRWTHIHTNRNPFIVEIYRQFRIPIELVQKIVIKGAPLLLNEFLWAAGMAMMNQCYSMRGLAVVAGTNICSTIANLFSVVFIGIGTSVSIIIGQYLGAGRFEEAKTSAIRIITLSTICCVGIGLIMIITAPLFPSIYNTTNEVKELATVFIRIIGLVLPLQAYLHATYFTIRSGGKTWITFVFDSLYVWVVGIPVAFVLTRYTQLGIIIIYLVCQLVDIIKCIVGTIMLKKGIWIQNIVEEMN